MTLKHADSTSYPPPSVLITGASRGIGAALTTVFCRAGWKVFGSWRTPGGDAAIVANGATPLPLDICDPAACQRLAAHLEERLPNGLDLLIHNGGWGQMGPLLALSREQLMAQLEVHLLGPHHLTRELRPLLSRSSRPCIVMVGSISALAPSPFSGAYCAAKAALHSYADVLRVELKPLNIDLIRVEPGAIASHFGATASANLGDEWQSDADYGRLAAGIRRRASFSQRQPSAPLPLAELVLRGVTAKRRPVIVRYGRGSWLLPLAHHWLPRRWYDRLMRHVFGL